MKKFVAELALIVTLIAILVVVACFGLPGTSAKDSMLARQINIENDLRTVAGERVVLVGGSGLGQGIEVGELSRALERPVINAGLHAGLGLVYQMNAVSRFIRQGDLVVVVPEYANFESSWCYGEMELLAMVVDVVPQDRELISAGQWLRMLRFIPGYGTSKIASLFKRQGKKVVSAKKSNQDPLARLPFPAARKRTAEDFDEAVLASMQDFKKACESRGARVAFLPAAFQRSSFDNQERFIERIAEELKAHDLPYAVEPKTFRLEDKYFYDTPYHMNPAGRQLRTEKLAQVIKNEYRLGQNL